MTRVAHAPAWYIRGMSSCDVSVIVPTLNEERSLPDLLRDLQRQTEVRLEVLVADGGSDDGTTALVESFADADHHRCRRPQPFFVCHPMHHQPFIRRALERADVFSDFIV